MIKEADGFGFYFVLCLPQIFFPANATESLTKFDVDTY